MTRLVTAAVAVMMATGCGGEAGEEVAQAPRPLVLTEQVRRDAAIEAATLRFDQTVRTPFLVEKGLSVRGLAWAVTKAARPAGKQAPTNTPADLQASQYDRTASLVGQARARQRQGGLHGYGDGERPVGRGDQ